MPNSQTSTDGGSTSSAVSSVQIWLRWSVPWWRGLHEPDADRGLALVPIVLVDLSHHGVRIGVSGQEFAPGDPVGLHRAPEVGEIHPTLVDPALAITGDVEQVPAVGSDEVAHRREDRTIGPRDGGLELLRAQLEVRIDQS
jgi:hypothetical protein